MRVYELSKQLNISSQELMTILRAGGFPIKSHMALITPEGVVYVNQQLKSKVTQKPLEQGEITTMQKERIPSKNDTKPILPSKPHRNISPQNVAVVADIKKPEKVEVEPVIKAIELVVEPMRVSDLALKIGKSINDIILVLLKWGIVAPKNQALSEEVITRLAEHFEIKTIKFSRQEKNESALLHKDMSGDMQNRLPVVVVVGHVDHGKTTLLDFIRRTRVAAKEKGGITQHIGAYEATTSHGNIVFIDTPGHAAFPKMRQRGIKVADIGVLVVAADDGIMPQTVEAIKQLKSMKVPIIVAINKVDKVDPARLEVIRRQLAEQDLLPEDWGGQTICVPVAAINGKGVDHLLEMIALQAQLMELKSAVDKPAQGYVLESKSEKGRGPVATIICQYGQVAVGDSFLCGAISGRVNSIVDSYGNRLDKVGASHPVQIAGFDDLPQVGDVFRVVNKDDIKNNRAAQSEVITGVPVIKEGAYNLILKTDANSSREAIDDAITKLSQESPVGFNIMSSAVGNVTESDVELAHNTGAQIVGLHVKIQGNALQLAERKKVKVTLFDIIYKLLESLEKQVEQDKVVEKVRTKIGEAIVRKVFDIKGVGVIAGSYVQDGRFSRDGQAVAWRGRQKIGEGRITSLQRDKKNVKEVHAGYECGFVIEGITDWHEDDRVECFIDLPKK